MRSSKGRLAGPKWQGREVRGRRMGFVGGT